MVTKLNLLKNDLVRLTDIKYLKKEFDRVAIPPFMRLFGQPKTVGKPIRGIKPKKVRIQKSPMSNLTKDSWE